MNLKWQLVTLSPGDSNHPEDLLKLQLSVHITRELETVESGVFCYLYFYACTPGDSGDSDMQPILGITDCSISFPQTLPLGSVVEVKKEEWILRGRYPKPMGLMCSGVWELISLWSRDMASSEESPSLLQIILSACTKSFCNHWKRRLEFILVEENTDKLLEAAMGSWDARNRESEAQSGRQAWLQVTLTICMSVT